MADFTLNVDCKFMEDFKEQLTKLVQQEVNKALDCCKKQGLYQDLTDEKNALDSRIAGILRHIGSHNFLNLPQGERDRVCEQYRTMSKYSDILHQRIQALTL